MTPPNEALIVILDEHDVSSYTDSGKLLISWVTFLRAALIATTQSRSVTTDLIGRQSRFLLFVQYVEAPRPGATGKINAHLLVKEPRKK